MSFWKSLFGGKTKESSGSEELENYKGFSVTFVPMRNGSEFQLSGEISKEVGGETRVHRLIRADRCASEDLAKELTLKKAKLVIDEQGDQLFDQ